MHPPPQKKKTRNGVGFPIADVRETSSKTIVSRDDVAGRVKGNGKVGVGAAQCGIFSTERSRFFRYSRTADSRTNVL